MGRYKMGPQGGYYDPNDSGPDQFTPTPGQQVPGMPAPPQQAQPDQQMPPWNVDMSGDPPPGYHWEWSGGVTGGKHPVPDGQHDPQVPGQGGPMGPPLDMPGWPRKQYPGGQGGPVPPWMTGGTSLGSLGQQWLESPAAGGSGRYDSTHPPPIAEGYSGSGGQSQSKWGGLGASLAALGVNGGNIAPKPSGGLAGAIFNKYPDLFGKR